MKPILVLAIGNPSRGDDAFGPLLAERLMQWLQRRPASVQVAVEIICEQQLMVEHVDDLRDRPCVLIIDAAASGEPGAQLQTVQALPAPPAVQSHQCPPPALLALYQHLLQSPPPPCSVLSVKGAGFELGAPLSADTRQALRSAWDLMQTWLEEALLAHA